MRHRKTGKRLSRNTANRVALSRILMTELFRLGRIQTTRAKAELVRSEAEHLVTVAKRGYAKREAQQHDVHERRLVNAVLTDPIVVKQLFDDIAPRFATRPGGYTRVYRLGQRHGDGAEMVVLELVS